MKNIHYLAILSLPLIAFPAAQSNAALSSGMSELIAGWDFSQFVDRKAITIDDPDGGEDPVTTDSLWANFSGLATGTTNDSTFNTDGYSGPDDYAYGTFYFAGQYGSSNLPSIQDYYVVQTVNLDSNLDVAYSTYAFTDADQMDANFVFYLGPAGQGSYNSRCIRFFRNDNSGYDASGCSMVFEANTGTDYVASGWYVEFAAISNRATSNLTWSYSTNGSDYTEFETLAITTVDSEYSVDFSSVAALNGVSEIFLKVTAGTIEIGDTYTNANLSLDNVAIRADLASAASDTNPFDGTAIDGYPEYFTSPWFCSYYHESGSYFFYVFDFDLGWLYSTSASSDEIYYWSYSQGCWCYTDASSFPYWGSWDSSSGEWAGWAYLGAE